MQETETGKHIDDTINFRPSPNFKHMKKYLKSKFEEENEEERKSRIISAVQPPLPPNSPPPECSISLKREIEDDGYEPLSSGYSPDGGEDAPADAAAATAAAVANTAAASAADTPHTEQLIGQKFIMCKDWVRGTCSRGAACIYVHELDKSQLKGVYRFCRDFENARCERQVCYFAHATTFEKEHFYRTAYLPPHALQHLKPAVPAPAPAHAPALAPAPAPASAPAHDVAAQPELPPLFANPPPPPALASGAVVPVGPGGAEGAGAGAGAGGGAAMAGAGALEARLPLDAFAAAAALPASVAVASSSQDYFDSLSRDVLARQCVNCPGTTLRMRRNKAQVTAALRAAQELDERLEQIAARNERLQAVLQALLRRRGAGYEPHACLPRDAHAPGLLSQMKVLLAKILLRSEADGGEKSRDPAT